MSTVRNIDVRPQANLSLAKTFGLCAKGITHRLLRSILTLAVVVLAVAFFMFLLSENAFVNAVADGVRDECLQRRLALRLFTRVFESPSGLALSRRLATAATLPEARAEAAAVTGWTSARIEALTRAAASEQDYLAFFQSIPTGKRLVLIKQTEGREIFRSLLAPEARAAFAERFRPMLDLRLPGGLPGFNSFLDAYPAYEAEATAFEQLWREKLKGLTARVNTMTAGREPEAWLAEATAPQVAAWHALVAAAGFKISIEQWTTAQAQLRLTMTRQSLVQLLSGSEKRAEWRRVFHERKEASLDQKMLRLADPKAAAILGNQFTPEQLAAVSAACAEDRRLAGLEQRLGERAQANANHGGTLRPRQAFLLLISFVVCIVGVANAMLMSITERFREIATMKCLGATDRYILVQFMIEAGLQGVAGGLLGTVLGLTMALVKNAVLYGDRLFIHWAGLPLLLSAGLALVTGVVLAVLASLHPSWAASRMAPMEAMRIE